MSDADQSSEEQSDLDGPEGHDDGPLPNAADASLTPFAAARGAMCLVWIVLACIALVSFACFVYQFWYRLENGDHFVGSPVRWPNLLGHLIRGAGLALVCWRLSQLISCTAPGTNPHSLELLERKCRLWSILACVLFVLVICSVLQVAYVWQQDRAEKERFFRPEFESGRVSFRKERIEFRRGFAEPKDGFLGMEKLN